ncbi:MAG: hypothetical protein J5925_02310, partial [Clostridia bacterium]|nr:hypothetical protein [Clostridia bacterium]
MKRTIAIVIALLMVSVLGTAFVSADETIDLLPAAGATWTKEDNNGNTVNIVNGNQFVGERKTADDTWPYVSHTYETPITVKIDDYSLDIDFTITGDYDNSRGAIEFVFAGSDTGRHLGNDVIKEKLNIETMQGDDFLKGTYKGTVKLSDLQNAEDPDWHVKWSEVVSDGCFTFQSIIVFACGGGTVTINKLALVPNNAAEEGGEQGGETEPEPKNEVVKDLGAGKSITGVTVKTTEEAESVKISCSVNGEQYYDLNTGAAVSKNEAGEFVLDFHTRGVINAQFIKVEGI